MIPAQWFVLIRDTTSNMLNNLAPTDAARGEFEFCLRQLLTQLNGLERAIAIQTTTSAVGQADSATAASEAKKFISDVATMLDICLQNCTFAENSIDEVVSADEVRTVRDKLRSYR